MPPRRWRREIVRINRIRKVVGAGVLVAGAVALCAVARVGHGAVVPALDPGRELPPDPPGAARFVIDPTASTVVYRVGETALAQQRFHVTVGVTSAIQGAVEIDPAHPRAARIGTVTVDISQFRSDNPRRDSAIRARWLESGTYPTAEFTPTMVEGLPEIYSTGRTVSIRIAGLLTMRTVTRPVTFTGTVTLDGPLLTGALDTTIRMTDFGFEPPSLLGIFQVDDDAMVEIRFTARRAL